MNYFNILFVVSHLYAFTMYNSDCKSSNVQFLDDCESIKATSKSVHNIRENLTVSNRVEGLPLLILKDSIAPTFAQCRDTSFAIDSNCELRKLKLFKTATDSVVCDEDKLLKWSVFVDLWGDGIDDYEFTSSVPEGNDVLNAENGNISAIKDDNGNGVKDIYLAPSANGQRVSITIPEIIVGKSSMHKVIWIITDGCNNVSVCEEKIKVEDRKAPTPVCVPLISCLMQDPDGPGPLLPMFEVLAIDFMNKAYDNCTREEDLLFTFEDVLMRVQDTLIQGRLVNWDAAHYFTKGGKALAAYPARETNVAERTIRDKYLQGLDNIQLWNPVIRSSAKVLTTAYVIQAQASSDLDVKVTVWDKKLNSDFCWTSLKNCLGDPCFTCVGIKGLISTSQNQVVNNISLKLDANIVEFPKDKNIDMDGTFFFGALYEGHWYQISASKDGDDKNGVSTLDLVMIQRHINGIELISNPDKMIAADVNNDGQITEADVKELRKLVLGIKNDLPNNQSWRFPAVNQILNPSNPFPYKEQIIIPELKGVESNHNFVAVKIGDINGNVSKDVINPVSELTSDHHLKLQFEDRFIKQNELVEVEITSSNFQNIFGYQCTMEFQDAEFMSIKSGALNINDDNIGIHTNGKISMSLASDKGLDLKQDEVLFTITLLAKKVGLLSDVIKMNSSITKAEAYVNPELLVTNISLEKKTSKNFGESIVLFQNSPNPFKGQTIVKYYMPNEANVNITIYDTTGKMIFNRKLRVNSGMNEDVISSEDIGYAGMFFYTLESGNFVTAMRMVVLE